jgi:RNA polymerase sigma-70 factor (ECF subfamily)
MAPTTNDLETHRAALTGHCYRMLGSVSEAEDAVQETMVRAWRALDRFEERSSLKTWLTRIATRVCLDLLADRRKRARSYELAPMGTIHDELVTLPSTAFVEPIAEVEALPADCDPLERAVLRQSIRLAFVAALQHLPPRQRAALLLSEVLGWSAAEIADCLETSVPAVNSALQRARATLAERDVALEARPAQLSDEETSLVSRWVEAFERYDMEALSSLLHQDATMSMPPHSLWLRGHEAISGWMLGRGAACRGSRLVPVAASGAPAFGQYKPEGEGTWVPWALVVLDVDGERFREMTFFLDTSTLFPRFGLPARLER